MSPLAPWLQTQLQSLVERSGHAFLLQGPSGSVSYTHLTLPTNREV